MAGVFVPNKFMLVRGDDASLLVHLLDAEGMPFSVQGATAIFLQLQLQDGSIFEKATTLGISAGWGQTTYIYQFNLTADETALLPLKRNQDLALKIMYGTILQRRMLMGSLSTSDIVLNPAPAP